MLRKNRWIYMLLPAVLFVAVFFAGGLAKGLTESFSPVPTGEREISAYRQLVLDESFRESFAVTLRIAARSTAFSSLAALVLIYASYCRAVSGKADRLFSRLVNIPMLFPYLMAAFMVYFLLSGTGFLSRAMYAAGIIEGPEGFPDLVNDESGKGIAIAYVWKTTPFMYLMMHPVVRRIETGLFEVGSVFGAGRLRFFMEAVFPRLFPVWTVSMLIVLAFTFSSFEVPYILGITHPKLLSVFAYEIFTKGAVAERPVALAANVIVLAFLGAAYLIAYILVRRFGLFGLKGGGQE